MVGITSRSSGETMLEEVDMVDWVLGCGECKIRQGWVFWLTKRHTEPGSISLGNVKQLAGRVELTYCVRYMPSLKGSVFGCPKTSSGGEFCPQTRYHLA